MILLHVLLENTTAIKDLKPMHGLSIAIDAPGNHLLLDVGPNGYFADNAARMGYDLRSVNTLVLSHAHADHTGGLDSFCAINKAAPVMLFDAVTNRYFAKAFGFIPLDVSLGGSASSHARIQSLTTDYLISDSVWFIKNTVADFPKPLMNARLYKKSKGRRRRDDFTHEGILVIDDGDLVVFNSCSHNGVCNSIESVKKAFPGKTIRSYVGGFHFHNPAGGGNEDTESMDRFCDYIAKENITLYTGHCTGEDNFGYLKQTLGIRVNRISTGYRLEV